MITTVVASYRYGHLASHCIETILSQSKQPDKIIFVDDGIGDCGHLPKLYPEVHFILRENNLGVVDNFQDILMNHIDTDRCMFIGADNWLRSDTIELLSEKTTDLVTYDIVLTGDSKEKRIINDDLDMINKKYYGDYYWHRFRSHHGSVLYNVEMAKCVGFSKRDESMHYTEEDRNMWEKMIDLGATVSYIPQGLLYYRTHRENYFKY